MYNRVSNYWQQPSTIFLFNISPILLSTQQTFTYVKVKSRSVVSNFLRPHVLYNSLNSSGQNTWVGRLSLLQGIFHIAGGFFTNWANIKPKMSLIQSQEVSNV